MQRDDANRVRAFREARGLSQVALAAAARLSRQSIHAIEAARAVPSVEVALRIASALDTRVEELFGVDAEPRVQSEWSGSARNATLDQRVALAHIAGRWVSLPLAGDGIRTSADGVVTRVRRGATEAEWVRASAEARDNVVMMGCAAGLGLLADRLNARRGAGRFLWFPSSSTAALDALAQGRTQLAGVHLVDAQTGEANVPDVRRAVTGKAVLVTLARWEAGLVVRAGHAKQIRGVADLGRRGLRIAAREAGAGAQRLLERELRAAGLPLKLARHAHWTAPGHLDVARAVAMGACDVGVATRDAALAFGLGFVVLAEERYDLVIPSAMLADSRLERLLDMLVSGAFRRELSVLGYDVRSAGARVAEVSAA